MFRRSKYPHIGLELLLHPIPKGRPRFSRRSGRTHTPKRTTDYQNELRRRVVRSLGYEKEDFPLYPKGVGVELRIDFIFERPKRLLRKRDPSGLLWRPLGDDGDNLEKAVLDALNGIIWSDDSQVVEVRWRKLYATKSEDRYGSLLGDGSSRVCIRVKPVLEYPLQKTCVWGMEDEDVEE